MELVFDGILRRKADAAVEVASAFSTYFSGVGPAPLAGDALRWARFLSDEKSGKESPKAGPSPALWNPPRRYWLECAPFYFQPLAR